MSESKVSCLCGQVQFVVKGHFDGFFLCHCQRCRKGTGSAHIFEADKADWDEDLDKIPRYKTFPGI